MSATLAIVNANILDASPDLSGPHHITIEDGVITGVLPVNGSAPKADVVIDADGRTTTAGLIDTHVHLAFDGTADTWWEIDPRPDTLAMRCYHHSLENLIRGITTVRDLGAPGFAPMAVRDAIRDLGLLGPRIQTCGRAVTSTGGHQWNVSFEGNGPVGVRTAVREVIKQGADCIKLFATGFPLVEPEGYDGYQMQPDEMAAAIDEAHERKRKVAVHACNEKSVRAAVEAGADGIEHGLDLTDDTLALMAEKKVAFAATLACVATFTGCNHREPEGFNDLTKGSYSLIRRAFDIGVPLVCGSDSGASPPGTLAWELEAMSGAGLSDEVVLASATSVAAEALGLEDRGALRAGLLGDVVVWKDSFYGDPHQIVIGGRAL
jgi:imidazolonepropionase-like amidohydrolase